MNITDEMTKALDKIEALTQTFASMQSSKEIIFIKYKLKERVAFLESIIEIMMIGANNG